MKTRVRTAALCLAAAWPLATAFGQPATGEARFLRNIRQLIFEGKRSGEGYFSADGKALIFQSEREPGNPFYQIYRLDLETGDSKRVSPGLGKTTCGFLRPGHNEALFASTHLDPQALAKQKAELEFRASGKQRRYAWDYDENMDVFSVSLDGGAPKRLTNAPGYDAEGSYSPDGSKIAFSSLRNAFPLERLSPEDRKRYDLDPSYFAEIYIMNADGSDQRRLTNVPGYDGGPFFSPDGSRIIFRRFDVSGMIADVYTMKLDGSDQKRLTDFGALSWAPYFHPSGEYVIFTTNKQGFSNFELYLVDREGKKEPVRVTQTDGFDGLAVFSPDGTKLAWTSGRTPKGESQIFLADWNHEAARAALAEAPERRAVAAKAPADAQAALKDVVGFLASDAQEGRRTGTEGAKRAADFIAARLEDLGLQPAGDAGSFFHGFDFTSGAKVVPGENRLSVTAAGKSAPFEVDKDFRPLSFSESGEVEGEVVFGGYGLVLAGAPGVGYDSFAGTDIKDKIVLVLRYVPEAVAPTRRQELNRYAGLRYKALLARERGAKAILLVSGPNSPQPGQLAPLSSDTALSGSGVIAASVSDKVADAILQAAGKSLKDAQTALDTENPHAAGSFLATGVRVSLKTALLRTRTSDRNVVGYLPPRTTNPLKGDILIGAHYDHLGRGGDGSLAVQGEENAIHNGADDNASGVAAVLQIAAALAAERKTNENAFAHGVRFALWSGEEMGILGSSRYAEKLSPDTTIAYLNFDMVGRLRDNKLVVQGVASSPAWKPLIEKRNVAAGFSLTLQDDPYLPTDTTAIYAKKIPVVNFFTGGHENYHRPSDDAETLDYAGLERIAKFARGIALDLAAAQEPPAYVQVAPQASGGSRETLRAYVGTIPDYAGEVEGLKLSGVRAGGPADRGGLRSGDVIVSFAGQQVKNVYDYTFALDAVKIGVPIEVEVIRDGVRLKLSVTPEARK